MANIYVTPSQLQQLKVFNKLRRAGVLSTDRIKAQKKEWWAQVHRALPSHLHGQRLRVNLTTGMIKLASTRQPVQV